MGISYPECYYCGQEARYVHWETVLPCCVRCIVKADFPNGANGLLPERPNGR